MYTFKKSGHINNKGDLSHAIKGLWKVKEQGDKNRDQTIQGRD